MTTTDDRWVSPESGWAGLDGPYFSGQYEPVADERDDDSLEVIGELPDGLRGAYLRNGGNPFFAPRGAFHVFDGDGMVHGVRLDGEGAASYSNRWVRSQGLSHERERGKAVFGGLSEFAMPDAEALEASGFYKNTANTNIIRHADRYLALMEGSHPTEITRELATVGEYDFDGRLEGPMTAHPKFDPDTGEMLFFGYSPFPPFLRFHTVSAEGELTHSTEVPIGRSVMMHDFVTTPNHVVFFDLPALFDGEALMSGGAAISWRPDQGARIGVMARGAQASDMIWIHVDPFFVFHFMNAWEDDAGRLVVHGCRAATMPTSFGDEPTPEGDIRPFLWQWTIDLATGTVTDAQLDDRTGDFPRINDARNGKPYRFGYHAHTREWAADGVWFDGVIQFDHHTGASSEAIYGPTHVGGEPAFAPDPDGSAENDGWLLNFVTDRETETTEFVVLDARDLTAGPVARVLLPRRVPFGFHGNWMPNQ